MSSSTYSAHLLPDPRLRVIVLTSGRLTFAAGLALILTLDISVLTRALGALAWLGFARFELNRLRRGFDHCRAIRVTADGSIAVQNAAGQWCAGRLMDGSLVLRKIGWLRLCPAEGPPIAELIAAGSQNGQDWRRLQVIWRHIGAAP